MDYTQQREDLIWNVDSDGDEYQNVLRVLNEDFRTFGESVTALMQKKASHEIERPIEYLKAASTEENIPEQYQMPYDEMIAEYKRRVAELTDTGYRIRDPKEA